jgi:DNA repair protein RadC
MRTLTEDNKGGSLLDEAIGRWMHLFLDTDANVNGSDAVEWLANWLPRAKAFRDATAGATMKEREDQIVADALRIVERRCRKAGSLLSSPKAMRDFLTLEMRGLEHEEFGMIFMDQRHRYIAREVLFRGTIDGAAIHPRECVKLALQHNTAAICLFHNHPSGQSSPSQADELITIRLKEAFALIDVRLVDHVIVGSTIFSFAEAGLM